MKHPALDPKLDERLTEAERRFEEVNEALASQAVLSDPGQAPRVRTGAGASRADRRNGA